MSVSFGPINSFAEFHASLLESLLYAESKDFYYPFLQSSLQAELKAIQAWTARGRTPLVSERVSVSFSWALFRTRDGAGDGDNEPSEHRRRLDLAATVEKVFREWPASEDALRRGRYSSTVTYPRKPDLQVMAALTHRLEKCLAALPPALIERPPQEAFDSKAALMADTMSMFQWIRWVLLLRLQSVTRGEIAPPSQSHLTTLLRPLALSESTWPLLYIAGEVDGLFMGELTGFNGFTDDDQKPKA